MQSLMALELLQISVTPISVIPISAAPGFSFAVVPETVSASTADPVLDPESALGGVLTGLLGTRGNDQIYGTPADEMLSGGAGRDQLFGNGGSDILWGGEGNDQIFGDAGDDLLAGEAGSDRIFGNGGNDRLLGGDGRDRIFSGSGNDFIDGGAGSDFILLNGGFDQVVLRPEGGRDRDIIQGFRLGQTRFVLADGLTFADLGFVQGFEFSNITAGGRTLAQLLDTRIEEISLASNFV